MLTTYTHGLIVLGALGGSSRRKKTSRSRQLHVQTRLSKIMLAAGNGATMVGGGDVVRGAENFRTSRTLKKFL